MSEQPTQQPEEDRVGETDHPQHRTPAGEGAQSDLSQEEGGPAETSLYRDGHEFVTVLTEDEAGHPRQGAGPDREAAIKDAKDPEKPIPEEFSPGK